MADLAEDDVHGEEGRERDAEQRNGEAEDRDGRQAGDGDPRRNPLPVPQERPAVASAVDPPVMLARWHPISPAPAPTTARSST